MHDSIRMSISNEAEKKHDGLVIALLNQGWDVKFSRDFLSKKLNSIYAHFMKTGLVDSLGIGFEKLVGEYENYNTEHIVALPLGGMIMGIESLEIGKITLRKATPEYLQRVLIGRTEDISQELVDEYVKNVLGERKETVCAEFRVVAEEGRAEERAIDECNRTLDILRFALPILIGRHWKAAIGFDHEVLGVNWYQAVIFAVGEDQGRKHSNKNFSPSALFINNEAITTLEEIGVFKLSNILKKETDPITNFEHLVLRGIHWYSTSKKTIELENKFLNLTTCLETFFTPNDNSPIVNAVAEGCAFVLWEEVEKRKSLFQTVKRLYRIRSGLSHGGKIATLYSEVEEIESIAWHLLYWMISKLGEFQTQESLRQWIQEQKFK